MVILHYIHYYGDASESDSVTEPSEGRAVAFKGGGDPLAMLFFVLPIEQGRRVKSELLRGLLLLCDTLVGMALGVDGVKVSSSLISGCASAICAVYSPSFCFHSFVITRKRYGLTSSSSISLSFCERRSFNQTQPASISSSEFEAAIW